MTGIDQWAGHLTLSPGLVIFLGSGVAAEEHTHHAVQFVWGLDGPVDVEVGGRRMHVESTLIPAGVSHRFDARGGRLALALVDPHGRRGVTLERAARRLAGRDIGAEFKSLSRPIVNLPAEQTVAWCDGVFARLGWQGEPDELSSAVKQALTYLDTAIEGMPRLSDAARLACVSPSWLTHAFSSQVGIPFRRFVLWLRIKRAVDAVRGGANLTEAAVHAGFSDSAHLSRVFRANVGLSPSVALRGMSFAGALWGAGSQPERSSSGDGPRPTVAP